MKDERYLQFQTTLKKIAVGLASINGYDRLKSSIEDVADWDGFQAIKAQIDTTLWFKEKGLIKEIEPKLPLRKGYSDILLSFSQKDIYCEVTSFQSIIKSIQVKKSRTEKKDDEFKIKRALRNLLDKTGRQLPQNYSGILVLDTTKSAVFSLDVRELAGRLLPQRRQIALIALVSWEGNGEDFSWDKNPTFFFINGYSEFRAIGEAVLKHLGQKGEVVGI